MAFSAGSARDAPPLVRRWVDDRQRSRRVKGAGEGIGAGRVEVERDGRPRSISANTDARCRIARPIEVDGSNAWVVATKRTPRRSSSASSLSSAGRLALAPDTPSSTYPPTRAYPDTSHQAPVRESWVPMEVPSTCSSVDTRA